MKKCVLTAAMTAAVLGLGGLCLAQNNSNDAQRTAAAAGSAVREQAQAIASMNRMLKLLGATDAMEAARGELRRISDGQEKAARQATDLARQTVGLKPDQLPAELAKELNDLAAVQGNLADRTGKLIEQMQEAGEALKDSDPAASTTLTGAAELGKKNDVAGTQRQAQGGIGRNQMADVSGQQTAAITGLHAMADVLAQFERRQLEDLRRQLAAVIEQVKKLKAGEESVQVDSVKAAAGTAPVKAATTLGDRQQQLQMNTIVLRRTVEGIKGAQDAASDLGDGAEQMGLAATQLYGTKFKASDKWETGAIVFLDAAIAKLEKKHGALSTQIKADDLAAFVKQYEQIRTAQARIKSDSEAIESQRKAAADGQVDRKGLLELAHLTTAQKAMAIQVEKLSADERLKDNAVIVWMNGQIAGAMGASAQGLSKAQAGTQVAAAQRTAIERLTDVINALKEEQHPPEAFVPGTPPPGTPPGPGTRPPKPGPLVPPLAQLKLIKAMQGVVNEQTASVDKALQTAANDAEKSTLLDEAAKLGKTQAELRGIMEKVIGPGQ